MRGRARPVLVASLLLACTPSRPGEATRAAGGLRCAPEAALPERLTGAGAVVLFGEVHGVRELPAFFGEAVCHLAAAGRAVAVALELPASEQAPVDRFLASDGSAAARAALLASPFWRREYQDGRSSEAMALLLERLRHLRAAGARVEVILFDPVGAGPVAGNAADREPRLAEALVARARRLDGGVLAVLTGNVHARTAAGVEWDPAFKPMGRHLVEAGLAVHALDCAAPAGTAWICRTDRAEDCRAQPVAIHPAAARPGVLLRDPPLPGGFHGTYTVSSLTASPPAVPGARAAQAPATSSR